MKAREEFAGKKTKCPHCGAVQAIPALKPATDLSTASYEPNLDWLRANPPGGEAERDLFPNHGSLEATPPYPSLPRQPEGADPDGALARSPSTYTRAPGEKRSRDAAIKTPRGRANVSRSGGFYWLFLLALVPLVIITFVRDKSKPADRLAKTIENAPPEVQERIVAVLGALEKDQGSSEDLFQVLPDHKLDSAAFLGRDSKLHWVFALVSAAAFLFLIALIYSNAGGPIPHLAGIALFTGTVGIILLLGFQLAAQFTQGFWFRGRGVITLVFYIVKFIGWSYSSALDPDSNFVLSAVGFTFGVGLCEELCKMIPIAFYFHRNFDRDSMDWRGAFVWGLASGVGFGVSEGIMYAGDHYNGISGGMIYLVRFVSCVGLHAIWAGAAAISIFRKRELLHRAESGFAYFLSLLWIIAVPMTLHGLYDTLLKKDFELYALLVGVLSFGWLAFCVLSAQGEADDSPSRLERGLA